MIVNIAQLKLINTYMSSFIVLCFILWFLFFYLFIRTLKCRNSIKLLLCFFSGICINHRFVLIVMDQNVISPEIPRWIQLSNIFLFEFFIILLSLTIIKNFLY